MKKCSCVHRKPQEGSGQGHGNTLNRVGPWDLNRSERRNRKTSLVRRKAKIKRRAAGHIEEGGVYSQES